MGSRPRAPGPCRTTGHGAGGLPHNRPTAGTCRHARPRPHARTPRASVPRRQSGGCLPCAPLGRNFSTGQDRDLVHQTATGPVPAAGRCAPVPPAPPRAGRGGGAPGPVLAPRVRRCGQQESARCGLPVCGRRVSPGLPRPRAVVRRVRQQQPARRRGRRRQTPRQVVPRATPRISVSCRSAR